MIVKIKDKEIELKQTFRSLIQYEEITNKTFNPSSLKEILTYCYCVINNSNKEFKIDYEDFLDYIDDNPNIVNDFSNWLIEINSQSNTKKEKKSDNKKK